jgi:hypothetical protein
LAELPTSRFPGTDFFLGFLARLSNSRQAVVVWFVNVLDGRVVFKIEPEAKSKLKKGNPDLLQIEEPRWRTKCGTDGSSRGYS